MSFHHSALQENVENSAKVSSLQSVIYSLDNKLDRHFNDLVNQIILLLPDHEVDEKELTRKEYVMREKLRIDSSLPESFFKMS